MTGKVKPIPDGYHTVTAYLAVKGCAEAIEFYRKAFGAEELYRFEMPGGKVGHAEIRIGDTRLMLADEFPDMPDALTASPRTLNGSTCGFMIYLPDADAAFRKAVEAGAKARRPVENQFYGDRSGTVEDPFGHFWTLATHVEDVSPEEMARRMETAPKG